MPAEVPADPIIPSQSNYYVSSGPMAPASGLQGALSGPWMLESQDLQIEYTREPGGWLKSQTLTLSSVSATEYLVQATHLNCIITANYSRKKSYDTYSNSSYQQSQKFQVYALSADENGTSYGDLNTSTLGPAGTIVTYQPFLSRRGWDDSLDSEIASSVTVANFIYASSGNSPNPDSYDQTDPQAMAFERNFIEPSYAGTPQADWEKHAQQKGQGGTHYRIQGPYTVQKETLVQLFAFIDAVGGALGDEKLLGIPAVPQAGGGQWYYDQGLNLYSKYRHDYS